jgi:hypothetical protein
MSGGRTIPVVQFMLPHGRQVETGIYRPTEIADKADLLLENGYRFEAEVLTTGEVSLTLSDPGEETDIFIEVVPNGPGVPVAFDRLVEQGMSLLAEQAR